MFKWPGRANSSIFLSSLQVLNRLDEAYPHGGQQSASCNPLIQMLKSSGNSATDSPKIMFSQISGYPVHIKSTITGGKNRLRKDVVWSRHTYSEKLLRVSLMGLRLWWHWVILGNCYANHMGFGDFLNSPLCLLNKS